MNDETELKFKPYKHIRLAYSIEGADNYYVQNVTINKNTIYIDLNEKSINGKLKLESLPVSKERICMIDER